MHGAKELRPPISETKPQVEQLRRWVERGFDGDAVAVYGTSVDVVRRIADTGVIFPYPTRDLLPYQKELSRNGRDNLYFAMPFMERVLKIHPQLVTEIAGRFDSKEEANEDLKTEEIRRYAKFYAINQAVRDYFLRAVQIKADMIDILGAVLRIAPEQFENFIKSSQVHFIDHDIEDESDKAKVSEIVGRIGSKNVRDALLGSLERRGVLIYLNDGIFTNTRVRPCFEAETEIVVVSKDSLSAAVISGVEVLSEIEFKELLG